MYHFSESNAFDIADEYEDLIDLLGRDPEGSSSDRIALTGFGASKSIII